MGNYYLFTSKKVFLFGLFLVSIAAFSSCSGDSIIEEGVLKGENVTTFTATIEASDATRTTYNTSTKKAEWVAYTDKINIGGAEYTANSTGATTTFTGTGAQKSGDVYKAYYPFSLVSGSTVTLPSTYTYSAGTFNMPMYAESTDTQLSFKNICGLLAITGIVKTGVTSITVSSDKQLNGELTGITAAGVLALKTDGITDDNKKVTLSFSEAKNIVAEDIIYIPVPPVTGAELGITVTTSSDYFTMVTQKSGGVDIARNTIYTIAFVENATGYQTRNAISPETGNISVKWVQLWKGGPKFATSNVGGDEKTFKWGATTVGGEYNSGTYDLDHDTAYKLWGTAWQMPTQTNFSDLISNCTYSSNTAGGIFTGKGGYSLNSVFFPVATDNCFYWSSTPSGSCDAYGMNISNNASVNVRTRSVAHSVRAILK